MSLVNPYIGLPKCQDCGWKLRTDLTDNCPCRGELTPEQELKHKIAYNRARELQTMNDGPQNHLTVLPAPVPEEFPPTESPAGEAPQFIDVGTLPWSKLPIAELSPQTWFAYEKNPVDLRYVIFDGNGRKLFYTEDEEIAAFAVKAMNLYVAAALQTQTEL